VKLFELVDWTPAIQSDDLRTEFDELSRDMLTDARRTTGDDDAPTVVAPEVVNLCHCS
jgi:hypothetical protein